MKLSSQKRDIDSAENGIWVTKAIDDMDLLIASMGNKKYTDMLRHLTKPYKRTLETLGDDFLRDLQDQCISKTVLLGWRNLESDVDGEGEIEYSQKVAYEILKDPENHKFREVVVALAEEEEVFKKQEVEDATFQAG